MTLPLTAPDLVCEFDLDLFAGETTSDLQSLEQDVLHMLLEAPGSNLDDLTRGIGVVDMLGGPVADLATVPHRIEAALAKDDRIDSSTVTIRRDADDTIRLTLVIVVGADVLGLNYAYSADGGLQVL